MSYDPPPELVVLLQAVLEGTLTQPQRAELASILASSQEAQRFFVDYLGLHATTQWQAIELFAEPDSSETSSPEPAVCLLSAEESVPPP
ncbi:MAG: hypothetical protein WD045_02290, partial [Pirellulaceae bacterium]